MINRERNMSIREMVDVFRYIICVLFSSLIIIILIFGIYLFFNFIGFKWSVIFLLALKSPVFSLVIEAWYKSICFIENLMDIT